MNSNNPFSSPVNDDSYVKSFVSDWRLCSGGDANSAPSDGDISELYY